MSEPSSPAVPAEPAVPAPEVTTPPPAETPASEPGAVGNALCGVPVPDGTPQRAFPTAPEATPPADPFAAVLRDFQSWLSALPSELPLPEAGKPLAPPEAPERIDLHTLLGQFLALRHEVNLQTRSVRSQQEQSGEVLRQLVGALDLLRQNQVQAAQAAAADAAEVVRPLLKTLVDLYDALALAAREVQRVQDAVLPLLEQLATTEPEAELPAPPTLPPAPAVPSWARWLGVKGVDATAQTEFASRLLDRYRQERQQHHEETKRVRSAAERIRLTLTGLLTGYTMSLQRLDRALEQHGLEPIPSVGETFDPDFMEVLEGVSGTGQPSGEVIEEVRRGYLYKGRIFRFAQVRVARS